MALEGRAGDLQEVGDLLEFKAAKVTQVDEARAFRVNPGKAGEGFIHGEHGAAGCREFEGFFDGDVADAGAALPGHLLVGVVDEDAAHHLAAMLRDCSRSRHWAPSWSTSLR